MDDKKKDIKMRVSEGLDQGTVLFNVPFIKDLKKLDEMAPIIIKQPYEITYIHSYGQDSPFFAGLANKVFLGTKCTHCGKVFPTPRKSCSVCGSECEWVEMPNEAKLHSFTVCHFGSESFLQETPYILALIEFEGGDTLFLGRLVGIDPLQPSLDWIGMKLKIKYRRLSQFSPTDVYFLPAD